jgi:hypothetical protein
MRDVRLVQFISEDGFFGKGSKKSWPIKLKETQEKPSGKRLTHC